MVSEPTPSAFRDEVLDVDVAIAGGGLVGASLALALAPLGLRLALIESQPASAGSASWDERCIALNAGSRRVFEAIGATLGVWSAMEPFAEPILSTHISERGRFGVARFHAGEAGLPALGYNVPVRALGHLLWEACGRFGRLQLLAPARVVGLEHEADRVRIGTGAGGPAVRARLLVAADGARSAVRTLLGIGTRRHDYGQTAIVSAARPRRALAGVAYERFLPSGPLALLPKPDDAGGPACSLVWTLPGDEAAARLAQDPRTFLGAAQSAFGERVGRFLSLGARAAYPLEQVIADRVSAPRVLLLGNAAQSLHPVAAQGFNLGLRDVATLAALLAEGGSDPGEAALLAAYVEQRRGDRERVAGFTDGLVRTFSNRIPAFAQLRHLGLLALDLVPPAKHAVMCQNLGLAVGQAPARLTGSR